MLKVYAAQWCPHCRRTVDYLRSKNIPFTYYEIEEQKPDVIKTIVRVNGGDDWVVPTLEFNGKWRPGEVFNEAKLAKDLREMGVTSE